MGYSREFTALVLPLIFTENSISPMKNLSWKKFLTGSLASGIIASSLLATAPADAQTSTGTFRLYTSPAGVSSQYHVYANNIDWSKPVGVVFYFDGDYWYNNQSKIHNPANGDLTGMARVANERNLVFVPVISPDKNAGGDGITWWEEPDRNGSWFREYANWFINATGTDRNNVWTIGYSGGAEFETFELGADNQTSWRSNGGSIMVGGGGSRGMQTAPNDAAKRMNFQWWEGTNDRAGITNPPTWSAYDAGRQGFDSYGASGYWNRSFNEVWGVNHYQYNFPSILTQALDKAGVKKQSGYGLKGAIGEKYYNSGAAGKYGQPTTGEFSLIDGGAGQQFSNRYTIYWSPNTGAHPVWWPGGIGNLYRTNGYENGFGFPTTDEAAGPNGEAYQQFAKSNGQRYTLYWSPETGTHSLYENGAIGHAFNNHSRSYGWGYPTMNETGDNNGAKQIFYQPSNGTRTAVYWSEGTGAHSLNDRGAISALWVANGYKHGFPIADETATARGGASAFFRDANGVETGYFWSEGTGVHTVNSKGALYWYWKQHGFIDGMGFPTHDERVEGDGKVHLRFSDGTHLTWSDSEGVKVAK